MHLTKDFVSHENAIKLISYKSNGGLVFPSALAYYVAIVTGKFFRREIDCNYGKVPAESQFPELLSARILLELLVNPTKSEQPLFPELNDHVFDESPEEMSGHLYNLVKTFVTEYIRLRMFALTKNVSLRQVGENLRHSTTRTLVWKNQ